MWAARKHRAAARDLPNQSSQSNCVSIKMSSPRLRLVALDGKRASTKCSSLPLRKASNHTKSRAVQNVWGESNSGRSKSAQAGNPSPGCARPAGNAPKARCRPGSRSAREARAAHRGYPRRREAIRLACAGGAMPACVSSIATDSRRGRRLADGGVDARHHLLGHELHRAPRETGVGPVHAGVDDLAEIADLLAQRQDLVYHAVDSPGDHAMLHHVVVGDLLVGLLLVALEHVEALAALH